MIAAASEQWEWGDLVSPILVKELRQGLRDRSFVLTFVAMQFALAFLTIDSLVSQGQSETLKYVLMYSICAVFFGLLPLWAAFSVTQEIRRNTLELILMTRTNAWWLLFGKWIARVFQAFLIGSTILPYVVLQYLNGGEELFDDLEFFIFIAVGNLILLATTVSLSVVRNPVVRGSSLVGLALSVLAVVVGYTSTDPTMMWDSFVIYTMLILTIGTIIVTLDLGSSDLTPYSAHNPLFRRLFCSVLFILTVIFYKFKASTSYSNIESGLIFLGSFIFMVYAAIEISREEYVSKRLIRPFKKLGWVGYILLLFFMPGRSSALLYMLTINATLLFLTLSLTTSSATPGDLYNRLWGTACVVGSLLIPLVLHVFFLKRLQVAAFIIGLFNVITLFFLIFAFQSLFHSYSIADSSFLGFFPCLATGTRVEVGVYSSGTPKESLFEAYFSLTVMIIALAVSSRYWLRVVHETWKETET